MSSTTTALEIVKTWLFNSPSHGLRRVGDSKQFFSRLVWAYILWVFVGIMNTTIYQTITNYKANPRKIHLSLKHYRETNTFPAITFCNINPLQDDGFLNDVRKSRLPGHNLSSDVNETEYREAVSSYVDRLLAAQVNGEEHPFVQWGFKLNDLLVTCVFNKKECYRNLTRLFHPNYGNCYTFNNENNVKDVDAKFVRHDWSVDDDSGHNNYKLYLELYLHQAEYNEYLENRAAFLIFIHRKHEVPILSENSIFVRPNRYTKLSFSQRIVRFSRQCHNDLTDYMKKIFRTHSIRYTQELCYKLCEQRIREKECHCIEPTLAVFYQFFDNAPSTNNITLCSIDNKCLIGLENFNLRKSCKECLPECETIQYSVQSSFARYPNVKASQQVMKRIQDHFRQVAQADHFADPFDERSANQPKDPLNNIVAVEISASPYATEILTEAPVYTWVDLISSIGGQTGLWMGVSLIGLVEVFELLFQLSQRFYSYLVNKP